MDKNKIKKPHDACRALAVKATAKEFEVTEVYVRAAISGTSKGGRVDEILKFYNEKYQAVKAVIVK